MIFLIEILLVVILGTILVTLAIDEKNHRKRRRHLVRLKTYWDGNNRRRVVRHNASLNVDYTINSHMRGSVSRDISTHGIGLVLDEKLKRKTRLILAIKMDGEYKGTLKARARVMWCLEAPAEESQDGKRLFYTGIKFIKFTDPKQEKRLFDYIRSIEKDASQYYASL